MIQVATSKNSVLTSVAAWALVFGGASVSAADSSYEKVIGSVDVRTGEHIGSATTVNGSVDIGADAVVQHATTVNGSINLGAHASAGEVNTVNGSITVADGAHVSGNATLVNGAVLLAAGAEVGGNLTTVNGRIGITTAHVGGRIETVNSDLTVGANSRVDGGIHYGEDNQSWWPIFLIFSDTKVPRVEIGPGAIVKGTLRFQRKVELYVSEQATISAVEGATVIRFKGAHP